MRQQIERVNARHLARIKRDLRDEDLREECGEAYFGDYDQLDLIFYFDERHGWLRVHLGTLIDYDLLPEHFSSFSYCDGHYIYLEEDCDAPKFLAYVPEHVRIDIAEVACTDKFSVRAMQRNKSATPWRADELISVTSEE